MASYEWILVWKPGEFLCAGYFDPVLVVPEGALSVSWPSYPLWWPVEATAPELSAVLPDTADAALVEAAFKGAK